MGLSEGLNVGITVGITVGGVVILVRLIISPHPFVEIVLLQIMLHVAPS